MANFRYDYCYFVVDRLLTLEAIGKKDYEELGMKYASYAKITKKLKDVKLINMHGILNKKFIDKKVFNDEKFNKIILSVLLHDLGSKKNEFIRFGESEPSVYNESTYALEYIFKDIPKKINLISNEKYSELIDDKLIQKLHKKEFTEILKYVCDIYNSECAQYVRLQLDDLNHIEIFILKLFNVADEYILYGKKRDDNSDIFIKVSKINIIIPMVDQVIGSLIPLDQDINEAVLSYIEMNSKFETLSLLIPMSVINFLSEKNLISNIDSIEPIMLKDEDGGSILSKFAIEPQKSDLYKVDMTVSKHVSYMLRTLIENNIPLLDIDTDEPRICPDLDVKDKPLYKYFDRVQLKGKNSVRYHHKIVAILIATTYHNYIGYSEIKEFLANHNDMLNDLLCDAPSMSSVSKFYKNVDNVCFKIMLDNWVEVNSEFILNKNLIDGVLLNLLKKCKYNELTNNYREIEIQTTIKNSGIIELLKKVV